ncbi:amino acid kinase family protein, partial [Alishewanella longhuensis]
MRVLKFGGSSLASVARFSEVAQIVLQQATTEQVCLVLSAPQGVTNTLVELTDLAYLGADFQPVLTQLEQRYQLLLQDIVGISAEQKTRVQALIAEQIQQLGWQLQGMSLLRFCPDHIKAQILGLGEQFSVALMTALLQARAADAVALDSVKLVKSQGDFLNATADVEATAQTLAQALAATPAAV